MYVSPNFGKPGSSHAGQQRERADRWQSEHWVDEVELSLFTTQSADGASAFRAPLFETVYNDHYMIGVTDSISMNIPQLDDPPALAGAMKALRQIWGARTYLGAELPGGATLSPDCVGNCPAFDDYRAHPVGGAIYQDFAQMLQRFLAVTKNQAARDRFRFGERLREPLTNAAIVDFSGKNPQGKFWPYDPFEPVVYVSAWGTHGSTVGLLFLNWTDNSDTLPGGVVGGAQAVTAAVNLEADYGLVPGNYQVLLVTPTGGNSLPSLTYTGGTLNVTRTIPERSAQMWIVH